MDERDDTALPTPTAGDGDITRATQQDDAAATAPTVRESTPKISTSYHFTLQSFTDKALDFLSHASNETLGACFIGLGASTYLVLGRVGLVIIGVAGGIVLHATWEGLRGDTRDEATKRADLERRREAGVEVARRLLGWRYDSREKKETESDDTRVYANQDLSFSHKFGPESVAALDTFTRHVIKDYVLYWYDYAIPGEDSFPASCKRTLTAFILSLSGHLQRKRPADAFLDFVTNSSSIIIVFLNELAVALNASPSRPAEEAIAAYLELKPDSSLSYMLDEDAQKQKLSDAAEEILQAYLDHKAYNCPPVHVFLKEVFAQLVLGYTVTLCSKPEWINDWIVYGLEESKTTKEVMDMVDAGVNKGTKSSPPKEVDPVVETQEAKILGELNQNGFDGTVHRRTTSRAEEAMDEAMREARRLTEMMLAEDERRAKEGSAQGTTSSSLEDVSDVTTQGVATPTSSQSDRERYSEETLAEHASAPYSRPQTPPKQQFTSFDQMVPNSLPTALTDSPGKPRADPGVLTLLNASVQIFDDSNPTERSAMKAKPATDYFIQIEPSSSAFAGWVISRKYADFEILHEVLRRISVITGVRFTDAHAELPRWRSNTKASLRTELERYLCDAVRYPSLAESEGMKRFLEKDQGVAKSPGGGMKGFGWPTPDAFGKFGGDMMNVLTKAPKQVAGGGKAVFGGVAGLVAGGKRPNASPLNLNRANTSSASDLLTSPTQRTRTAQTLPVDASLGSTSSARASQDSLRAFQPSALDRRDSSATTASTDSKPKQHQRPPSVLSQTDPAALAEVPMASSIASLPESQESEETMNLPPPPSEMPADYGSMSRSRESTDTSRSAINGRLSESIEARALPSSGESLPTKPTGKPKEPISERETSVAIELMFAVITELYTLSSAWQIRRTLLAAAKTFLLRPGNPQLLSIRDLLQTSLLEANLSDAGIAHQIYELRRNSLPTPEELEAWKRDYPEKTEEQKEELRIKARKLLITKGMPQALTSVMGAAASGEALGKVFDCLQVPSVSRGLIFGLMLQALRIVTH